VLDWLRLSPLAPWHYLTYHKAFHFDVSLLLALGGSRVTQTTKCFAKAGIGSCKTKIGWRGSHGLAASKRRQTAAVGIVEAVFREGKWSCWP